jgi:hypothetical protein
MKSILSGIFGVVLLLSLSGCGERVDTIKTITEYIGVTCEVGSETETTVTFICSDGTDITVNKPERLVEVEVEVIKEVEVPVIIEVPIEICTDSKITICFEDETLAVSLDALDSYQGAIIGACPCDRCDNDEDCKEGFECDDGKCKKKKCNNGGGNGPEGCSPSENGNDDE